MTQTITEDLSWVVFAEEEPDDLECQVGGPRIGDCTRQPVWRILLGRDCGCFNAPPFPACGPHKDLITRPGTEIICDNCGGPAHIVSVTRL